MSHTQALSTRPLYPIPAWQAALYDLAQLVIDWIRVELARPAPPLPAPEPVAPEPAWVRPQARWGLVRRGWKLAHAVDAGRGRWLPAWLLWSVEETWNAPRYGLTAAGGLLVVLAAPRLPAMDLPTMFLLGVLGMALVCMYPLRPLPLGGER